MIYVDLAGHMITDGPTDELHAFAEKIGLKREWYQDKRLPHYDLTTQSKIRHAIKAGADMVPSKEIVKILIGGK